MKVINLFGAPGSGKSTTRAGLFYEMKKANYNVEEVTEYAKDMVWEERFNVFNDQLYLLGKQNRRLLRLDGKVDYILTDSPILLGINYMVNVPYAKSLEQLSVDVFNSYDNYNFFLNRSHEYSSIGRNQNEAESNELSVKIKETLTKYDIPFIELYTSDNVIADILDIIEELA
jgi:tRNA uridine 5-carbamoylmethylation protein Kti12